MKPRNSFGNAVKLNHWNELSLRRMAVRGTLEFLDDLGDLLVRSGSEVNPGNSASSSKWIDSVETNNR